MLEEYIYHGKERLRCGYTTGSCAAAAAKASVIMYITRQEVTKVRLVTPKGIELTLDILDRGIKNDSAFACVQKDSGDDPDITNGIKIYAGVFPIEKGIEIVGGEGIGIVTCPGLDCPVGQAAINSVPRKMITQEVLSVCEQYGYKKGFRIEIFAPMGKELAKKTYNPRMGIVGGISIIGTSGIVEPMSSKAVIDTIRGEIKIKKAGGAKNLVLTIGNYSDEYLEKNLPMLEKISVKCSNFIGEALDFALEFSFERVLIIGHIGKLVKLGAGIMNTHSSYADGRMDVIVTCGVIAGVEPVLLRKIPDCVTVDSALEILRQSEKYEKAIDILMERAEYYLNLRVKEGIKAGALMFSNKYGVIGQTKSSKEIMREIREEWNG